MKSTERVNARPDRTSVAKDLRLVWIFVIATFLLSALFDYPIFGPKPLSDLGGIYLWLVMWCPGTVALALVLLGKARFRELGLMKTGGLHLTWGLLIPLVMTGPIYLLASAAGFCGLAPWALKGHLLGALLMLPRGLGRALGEEIGWRGFLFPRLRSRFSFPMASLLSGLIWSVWHYAVIVQGGYLDSANVTLGFGLVLFTICTIGESFLYGWLRERSDSVWPAVCLHGVYNWFTQRVMEFVLLPSEKSSLAVGELSIGFALMGLILAALFWREPGRVTGALKGASQG